MHSLGEACTKLVQHWHWTITLSVCWGTPTAKLTWCCFKGKFSWISVYCLNIRCLCSTFHWTWRFGTTDRTVKLQLQVTSGGQGNTVSVSLNHFSYFQLPDYYLVHSKFSHSFFYRHHSEISPTVQGFLFKICDMDYGGPLTNYMDRCYVILYTIEGRKKKKNHCVHFQTGSSMAVIPKNQKQGEYENIQSCIIWW